MEQKQIKKEKKIQCECHRCKKVFDEDDVDLIDGDYYCRLCEDELR